MFEVTERQIADSKQNEYRLNALNAEFRSKKLLVRLNKNHRIFLN